jgi:hypothetical protein
LFALVLLLIAKALGGTATLPQHLAAVAMAAFPAVLSLLVFAPDLSAAIPIPSAASIKFIGRLLALIGIVWSAAILVKALSEAHRFGPWRSAGALALTGVAIAIGAPVLAALAASFLLAP